MSPPFLVTQDNKQQAIWGQLYGSSLPLAIAEYCQQTPGIKLLITPDHWYAKQLADALGFFLKEKRCL